MLTIPNLTFFIITFASGVIAYFIQKKSKLSVNLLLAFSGAFLLSTCVLHLLPEIFEDGNINAAPFILVGFFLQILIDFISQGVEHGHIHKPHKQTSFPYLIYLGLCLHAFAEGMPISGIDVGIINLNPLFWGVLLHKIPIAVILSTLLLAYNVRSSMIIFALFFFAIMTPLGGYSGSLISEHAGSEFLIYFLAASTGIFLHISTVIIFESSKEHSFNLIKLMFIVSGGLLSVLLF